MHSLHAACRALVPAVDQNRMCLACGGGKRVFILQEVSYLNNQVRELEVGDEAVSASSMCAS